MFINKDKERPKISYKYYRLTGFNLYLIIFSICITENHLFTNVAKCVKIEFCFIPWIDNLI